MCCGSCVGIYRFTLICLSTMFIELYRLLASGKSFEDMHSFEITKIERKTINCMPYRKATRLLAIKSQMSKANDSSFLVCHILFKPVH